MEKSTILKEYINLSESVDGYFAEDYFDSVEKIMKTQKGKIMKTQKDIACATLLKRAANRTKRLAEVKNK